MHSACAVTSNTLRLQRPLSLPEPSRSPHGDPATSKHCPGNDDPNSICSLALPPLLQTPVPHPLAPCGYLMASHSPGVQKQTSDPTYSLPHLCQLQNLDIILDPPVSHPHPLSGNTVGSTYKLEPRSAHLVLSTLTSLLDHHSILLTASRLPTSLPQSVF